jgi:hypothetical protein
MQDPDSDVECEYTVEDERFINCVLLRPNLPPFEELIGFPGKETVESTVASVIRLFSDQVQGRRLLKMNARDGNQANLLERRNEKLADLGLAQDAYVEFHFSD